MYLRLLLIVIFHGVYCNSPRPHIVVIIADDLGWNDVGFHGSSDIPTPNIDALGYNGVILDRHYSQSSCTPSRAAFLTGQYPIRFGYQGTPLFAGEHRTIPHHIKTLPKELKKLGYMTHLVGKWHLGAGHWNNTPIGYGYNSHYGYWNGYIGSFDHLSIKGEFKGIDLHDNLIPVKEEKGISITNLLTKRSINIINDHPEDVPLFLTINHLAPHTSKVVGSKTFLEVENITRTNEKYSYIKDPVRRLLAEVVEKMDESVGIIIKRLQERKFLENSIVVFFSDNGAPTTGAHENHGSNFPFRGIKLTPFEGGVRCPAVVYSNKLIAKGRVFKKLFHITDWVPTLYSGAGGDPAVFGNIDGVDQWDNLCLNQNKDIRQDMLVHLDEVIGDSALIGYNGTYKIVNGSTSNDYTGEPGSYDSRYMNKVQSSETNYAIGRSEARDACTLENLTKLRMNTKTENCRQSTDVNQCSGLCLYNLELDPCETRDVSRENPEIVTSLWRKILRFKDELVPQQNKPVDPRSDPKFCNGTWFNFLDGTDGCFYNRSMVK